MGSKKSARTIVNGIEIVAFGHCKNHMCKFLQCLKYNFWCRSLSDIVSKFFGDRMKGKPLSLLGLKTDMKVVDARPTNIPIVQAQELRVDSLSELEDGSVAILDYESTFKKSNFTKYGRYILNVIDRYMAEGKHPDIHMMVLYTADIGEAQTVLYKTACDIQVEAADMINAPSGEWLAEAWGGIENGAVMEKALMHSVLIPLTYHGEGRQQEAIRQCVDLARKIPDKDQRNFALAGILTFTDKIIGEDMKTYVAEALMMTEVGNLLLEKGRQEGEYGQARKTAFKMNEKKFPLEYISEMLEFPASTIQEWLKGLPAKV